MRLLLVALLLIATPAFAQEPISESPDVSSWATAFVNPGVAAFRAIRSNEPKCQLSRLAVAEGIGNGTSLLIKRFVSSPRPCLGCRPDGMPSGHSMNSVIGLSSQGWAVSIPLAVGTGALRVAAHRHTKTQVVMGLLLGGVAEWASYRLVRCAA